MNVLKKFEPTAYAALRIVFGFLFACHGASKVFSVFGGHKPHDVLGWTGAGIELAGGVLILIGLLTHLAAFLASGEMAVAYFMVHAAGKAIGHAPTPTEQFFPILNKGELAVVLCWVFLFMVFYGSGRWSIDAVMFKTKAAVPATA
jgi:putative oxidoreductase